MSYAIRASKLRNLKVSDGFYVVNAVEERLSGFGSLED